MNKVASIKDRLKSKSMATGKTMQEMLVAYGLERTIYRISISKYANNFTLKGGIFLYALFDGAFARATTDIDLLAQHISNDAEDMKKIFTEIFTQETDDPLRFDTHTLKVSSITEFKKYHGVNIAVMAYLDRTRIPVSIDIGFGDVIYPDRVEIDFPTVLSDKRPRIFAYSLSSAVAEKFEAIVSLGYDNSRFKDFYDLYILAINYDFTGDILVPAVRETFENRNTSVSEVVAFEDGFASEPQRQSRWKSFIRKKKVLLYVTLEETILTIKEFMTPVMNAISQDKPFSGQWLHETKKWVDNDIERGKCCRSGEPRG